MKNSGVQRTAFVTLCFVTILVFVGAIVRTSGAGLGCPDWPTCWGELIPPWKVEQVDFESLNVERFQKKAKLLGRDPSEITRETLRGEFNGAHTYIEFVNRLFALPVLISSFILMVKGLRRKTLPRVIRRSSVLSFVLVIVNAVLGAAVVFSGLKTGFITAHMIAAFILTFLLVYVVWAGVPEGQKRRVIPGAGKKTVGLLLALVLIEGLLGSQIREMTDVLQRTYGVESRPDWIGQIDDSWLFLVHRSFSWAIVVAAVWGCWKVGFRGVVPKAVFAIVIAFMLMGIVFTHIEISAVVQVLHVGLASILVSLSYYWWLAADSADVEGDRA
ncbi:COX15/CtaA family protein [Akkermansiaceae bacterium]|nr:COX15/CtaA family protein [Akkermansiaceae bacterium]